MAFCVVQVGLSVFHPVADKGFCSRRMSASLMRYTWPSAYFFSSSSPPYALE
jgi:hypothetical protein